MPLALILLFALLAACRPEIARDPENLICPSLAPDPSQTPPCFWADEADKRA